MKNSTWKITTLEGGQPVVSVEGVSQENAVAAIHNAMSGRDPLAAVPATGRVVEQTETVAVAA